MLRLRLVSKQLKELVAKCSSAFIRHYVQHELDSIQLHHFPPPAPGKATFKYLIEMHHRKVTSEGLTRLLCDYADKQMNGWVDERKRCKFTKTYDRMREKMIPLIYTLAHFLEEFRLTFIHRAMSRAYPHPSFKIYSGGAALWDEQEAVMDRYDPMLLLDCYHVYGFLLQAIEHLVRPTRKQRLKRRLTRQPPWNIDTQEIANLLVLGGMDQVYGVLRIWRRSKRQAALTNFTKGLDPAADSEWQRNWSRLGIQSRSFRPHLAVPNLRLAMPALHLIWVPCALTLMLGKQVIESIDYDTDASAQSVSEFVSLLVGYDVTVHSTPPENEGEEDDDHDTAMTLYTPL
jgi:hypothetical protein